MNNKANKLAEEKVLDVFRDEVFRHGQAQYHQALLDVSSILGWLTAKPALPRKKLAAYVLSAFDKAAETLPGEFTIRNSVCFYRRVLNERPGRT